MAISSITTCRSASTSAHAGRSTMSAITSSARSRWRSRKRAYTEVVSLLVPALISAPIASKISSISVEPKLRLPLNSRCSMKCETPAWPSASSREPAPTHRPSAIERTPGIASVTTRTPASSSVRRWRSAFTRRSSARQGARACGAPSGSIAPLAAMVPTAAVAAPPVAAAPAAASPISAPATAAVAAAAAAVTGADARELVRRLAGDLGVVGEAQADAAALLVDLDDPHRELVAPAQHLLDRLGAPAGRDVRDVQEAIGPLGELDERAERRGLDDLAGVLVADLDLLGHLADAVDERVALGARLRVDEHDALVVDVDLGVVLLAQGANRLAALADHHADLRRVDLDRADPRGVLGELGARLADRVGHLREDLAPPGERLVEGVAQDLEGDAADLDVHLERGDPTLGAGDLEVHVAEVILDAGDVGQHDVVLALLDEAHGNARHRALDRHAGIHEREARAAHRGHRRRAVRLEDVGDHAQRVRELLLRGHDRHERALGERSVTDVAALRTAHEARLADRERREVVVVEVALLVAHAEVVDAQLLARRPERRHRERLRLAAGEDRRTVSARRGPDLDPDRAYLVGGAAVGALLVDGDAPAHRVLLELVEGELDGLAALRVLGHVGGRGGALAREGGVHVDLDPFRRLLALELVLDRRGRLELGAEALADLLEQRLVDLRDLDLGLGLARLLCELALGLAQLPDLAVGDVERVEHLGLGDLLGPGLDHEDRLLGAGHHEVELGVERVLLFGVDDEVALVVLADPHRADRRGKWDVGDGERGARPVHGEDVVRVDVVDRQRDRHELRLAPPALGEERAQRAVDHARGERALLAGAALAAEEGAGNLARGVHPLLDVDGQREEVDVAQVAGGRCPEHERVAGAERHRSARLLGEPAGLESDLHAADFDRDALPLGASFSCHAFLSSPPPVGGLSSQASLDAIRRDASNGLPERERAARATRAWGRRRVARRRRTASAWSRRPPGPPSGSRAPRARRPPPSGGRARSARGRDRAHAPAATGAGRRSAPGRRTASRASPRTAPGAPPPRRRGRARARAGASRARGSGGRRGAAGAPRAGRRPARSTGTRSRRTRSRGVPRPDRARGRRAPARAAARCRGRESPRGSRRCLEDRSRVHAGRSVSRPR